MTERERIRADMMKLKTYKPEYETVISRLAEMRKQYSEATKLYKKMLKDNPDVLLDFHKPSIVSVMEGLRRDMRNYEADLGLTPAAQNKMDMPPDDLGKPSKLAAALMELSGK